MLKIFVGGKKKAVRFLFYDNTGITDLLRDANIQFVLLFFVVVVFVVSLTDWNQGFLIACSFMLSCFTSSYRRDLCKMNWHIVKYLLHIVYKSILF